MLNVLLGFMHVEWDESLQNRDALVKLTKTWIRQILRKLWLAGQHDLQQFLARGFEIRKEAQRFQRLRIQRLCLIDNHYGSPAGFVLPQEQFIDAFLDCEKLRPSVITQFR